VKPADIGAADRHQILLHLEVIARSHRPRLIGRGVHAIDGVENPGAKRARNDPALDNHHRGGLVDPGKPEKPVLRSRMRGSGVAEQTQQAGKS